MIQTGQKGHKSADLLVVAISRALALYLSYYHVRKGRSIFYENILRACIFDVSQAYGWFHKCEYRLANDITRKKGPGAYKKIDHVLAYNKQIVAIETKMPKFKTFKQVDFENDRHKLEELFIMQFDEGVYKTENIYAYIIIASEERFFKEKIDSILRRVFDLKQKVDEKKLRTKYAKKKNILSFYDYFITTSKAGGTTYMVKAVKVNPSKISK